jgi:hypothetical protein
MNLGLDRWLVVSLSVLAAAVAFLLFGFRYLPSVDFPQHVAQLSAWVHLSEPAYGFAQQFEANLSTPYLLSYILARPFVPWLGALGALKLVVFFAALANVGAYVFLLRAVEQDPWVGLLGFPLTFGFCFYFGFINFLLAVPLIVTAVAMALRYARSGRWQEGLCLAAVLGATLLTHGLAFGVAAIVAFAVSIGEAGVSRWRSPRFLWPLFLPTLVAIPWVIGFGSTGVSSGHPYQWAPRDLPGGLAHEWGRVLDFPGKLLAMGLGDFVGSSFGFWLIVVAALSLGRYSTSWHRWALYAVAMGAYLLAPFQVLGVAFVYERFAALVVPGMILLAGPSVPVFSARARRPILVALSLAWLAILLLRARAFNVEASDFDRAVANLPPGLRVRPLVVARTGNAFPGVPVYLHFPAYYQAEHGGYLGYSFARYPTTLVRYRPGVDAGMSEDEEWKPELFDAARDVPRYDCFMVRSATDMGASLFRGAPRTIDLAAHVGMWWVYRARD